MQVSFAGRIKSFGRSIATICIVAGCLVACKTTTVAVNAVNTSEPKSRIGVPYPLMYNAYDIEVTRRIVACEARAEVFFKADIKPLGSRPDPRHVYVIDPNSLASWMKTSEVSLAYFPSGAVKSLNATAEDKSGEVIGNVTRLLSKVALIGAGVPGAPLGVTPPPTPPYCTQAVTNALKNISTLNPKVAAEQGVVDSLAEEIKDLMAKLGGVGGQPDAATRKRLSQRYDDLQSARQRLDKLTDDLSKQLKVVTEVDRYTWPRDGNDFDEAFPVADEVLQRWLVNPNRDKEHFSVAFALGAESAGNHARVDGTQQEVDAKNGIPFRPPVPGALRVCKGSVCPVSGNAKENEQLISRMDAPILQLGQIYYLECKSRPFSNVGCSFEMTESGQLAAIGTVHKTAIAATATVAARDIADQILITKTELAGLDRKKAEARLAQRKAEADLLAVERSLNPGDVAERTKVLLAEAELAKAETAKLEAEEALRVARLAATGSGG